MRIAVTGSIATAFLCTTGQAQNQIASFYAGAMEEAREIELRRPPIGSVVWT